MNNEPAFPATYGTMTDMYVEQGMTLRDYFAAKAMHAMLSNQAVCQELAQKQISVSEKAYLFADGMMRTRNKEPE